MADVWRADPSASMLRRLGRPPQELGASGGNDGCPDIWELDNGDVAVIGRDLTTTYQDRLPEGASVAAGERLVVIPRATLLAAKPDIPDA